MQEKVKEQIKETLVTKKSFINVKEYNMLVELDYLKNYNPNAINKTKIHLKEFIIDNEDEFNYIF